LVVEAVQWYADLIHEHDAASPLQAFVSPQEGWLYGKLAMGAFPLSNRGGASGSGWAKEWPMRWGMVPLPRDEQGATMATLEGYAISSATQHPDACWRWMSFLSRQMPFRAVPARRSLVESPEYARRIGDEAAAVVRAVMVEDTVLVFTQDPQVLMLFVQAAAQALSGQVTAQEAMRQAQRQFSHK
jgi:ABC-type glycerol-3-phosphate transport system substrate-binding protein